MDPTGNHTTALTRWALRPHATSTRAPYGALVANRGGTIFVVGGSYVGTAPASGEILLAVNDNLGFHFDNEAGFATQIRTG